MMNKMTGLPEVKSATELGGEIKIDRLSNMRYLTTRRDADGLILSSFRVEGSPIKASPLTAALNFLIFPDWRTACALFPFMGATPGH